MDYIKPKRNKTIKGGDTVKINDEKSLPLLSLAEALEKPQSVRACLYMP